MGQGPSPDLALHFPPEVNVAAFAPHIQMPAMRRIDFVARLRAMTGPVIVADYVSVGGPFLGAHSLPPDVLSILQAIPPAIPDIPTLEPQLAGEYPIVALECSIPARALPEALFARLAKMPGILSCQVCTLTSTGIQAKCNPRVDQNLPFDILVTLKTSPPPDLKPGAVCTFTGAYTSIMTPRNPQKGFAFEAQTVKVHGPGETLDKLTGPAGTTYYAGADEENLKRIRAQADADSAAHKAIRAGLGSTSATTATPATPATAPTPVTAPAPSAEPPKPEPTPAPEAEKPVEETPVIDEPDSDVRGKDPLEVALKLMQAAPEASYTARGNILETDTFDADDPVARMARLRLGGFNAEAFASSADKYLGELDRLTGKSGGTTGDTYDVGEYDVGSYDQGGDYGNYGNYGSYGDSYGGSYGGDYSGGYSGGYTSW